MKVALFKCKMICKSCGAEISTEKQEEPKNECGECSQKRVNKGKKVNIILFYILVLCYIVFTLSVFFNEILIGGVVISISGFFGLISLYHLIKDNSRDNSWYLHWIWIVMVYISWFCDELIDIIFWIRFFIDRTQAFEIEQFMDA